MTEILSLTIKPDQLYLFSPFFQQGVIIKTLVGCSIKDLLVRHLAITPEFAESRIQTVFLDGKAVDDLDHAVIQDGSTLALSGALPGLVGATLRRGGFFASLRHSITHRSEAPSVQQKKGRIVLKLFNLLVPELGPFLLTKGVWIKKEDLDRFLGGLTSDFQKGSLEAAKNGRKLDVNSWVELVRPMKNDLIFLKLDTTSSTDAAERGI